MQFLILHCQYTSPAMQPYRFRQQLASNRAPFCCAGFIHNGIKMKRSFNRVALLWLQQPEVTIKQPVRLVSTIATWRDPPVHHPPSIRVRRTHHKNQTIVRFDPYRPPGGQCERVWHYSRYVTRRVKDEHAMPHRWDGADIPPLDSSHYCQLHCRIGLSCRT